MNSSDIYQDEIVTLAKSGTGAARLENPDATVTLDNPLCGDQLVIYLKLDGDRRVADVSFLGKGCAICMASASMMTELLKGRSQAEAEALFEAFHDMCTGEENGHELPDDVEKLRVLSGVREFPTRVKCATLPWHTMVAALKGDDEISTE